MIGGLIMFNYAEAKQTAVDGLTRAAAAHEAGRYNDIGLGFDAFDSGLPRDGGAEFKRLLIAVTFWDGWVDARNHGWLHYEGINEPDWPVLARSIAASLVDDQEITEPLLLRYFDFEEAQPRQGWLGIMSVRRTHLFYVLGLCLVILAARLLFISRIDRPANSTPIQVTLEELADTPERYVDRAIEVRGFTRPGEISSEAQQCGATVNGILANHESDLGGIRKVEIAAQFPLSWSTYTRTTIHGWLRRQGCGLVKPAVWYIEVRDIQNP